MRYLALCTMLLAGCGAWSSQKEAEAMHRGLDSVTHVVDPLYGAAVTACDGAEGVIVRRDSSKDQDQADMAKVRTVCDRVFASFTTLREAQMAARKAIDVAQEEDDEQKLMKAIELVVALRKTAVEASTIWGEAEKTLKGVIE